MCLHESIEIFLESCAGSGRKINFSDSVVGLGSQERNKVIKKTTGKRRAILLDILIVFSLILDYQRMGQLKRCLQESFSPSHYGMAM